MPVSLFQMLFALVNPMQAALKFQKLARLDPDGAAARLFVALEDWLADGVPMPARRGQGPAGRLADPQPDRAGGWRFLGGAVDPAAIERAGARLLRRAATPSRRRRWRSRSAAAIPGARDASGRAPATSAWWSARARGQVWRPLADFLAAHAG